MSVHKLVTPEEAYQLQQCEPYPNNRAEKQSMKKRLLKQIQDWYGEKYWRLKEGTRQALDMMCFFAADRGHCFAKDEYLSKRYGITDKTIRNVERDLREAGIVMTIYRRRSGTNARASRIMLFTAHPYFDKWYTELGLGDFRNYFQNKKQETPCESKAQEAKKKATIFLDFKSLIKRPLRKQDVLDASFTPANVPKIFVEAAKPYLQGAEEIHDHWKKVEIAYRKIALHRPIKDYAEIGVEAFKQTVYKYKHGAIKKTFAGYFFGTVLEMLKEERRRETAATETEHPIFYNWLEDVELPY